MENQPSPHVIVTDVRMPFWSMVVFMIKWAVASIPAIIILAALGALVFGITLGFLSAASGIGSSLVSSDESRKSLPPRRPARIAATETARTAQAQLQREIKIRDLAEILSPDTSAERVSHLCKKWLSTGYLNADHRAKCATTHLDLARQNLRSGYYSDALQLLSYSEMEGGDLAEIRKLRATAQGQSAP